MPNDVLKQCENAKEGMPHEPHEWRTRTLLPGMDSPSYHCGGYAKPRVVPATGSAQTDPADSVTGTGYADAVQRAVEGWQGQPRVDAVQRFVEGFAERTTWEQGEGVGSEEEPTNTQDFPMSPREAYRRGYLDADNGRDPAISVDGPAISVDGLEQARKNVEDDDRHDAFMQRHIAIWAEMDSEAEAIYDTFMKAFRIYLEKKRLYGSAWRELGALGNFVRIHSKITRIKNIVWANGAPNGVQVFPENPHPERTETVDDNLLDLMVLCAFMVNNIGQDNWRGK